MDETGRGKRILKRAEPGRSNAMGVRFTSRSLTDDRQSVSGLEPKPDVDHLGTASIARHEKETALKKDAVLAQCGHTLTAGRDDNVFIAS